MTSPATIMHQFVIYTLGFIVCIMSGICTPTDATPPPPEPRGLPVEIRAGLLLETGRVEIIDQVRIQPAVDIAFETVRRRVDSGSYLNFNISYVFRSTGPICNPTYMTAPGVASDLYHGRGIHALLGPACPFECEGVSDLAAYWNVPVLTGAAISAELANKARYKTLTRTAFQNGVMGHFSLALFRYWSWKLCSIIWLDLSIWKITSDSIVIQLEAAGIYVNRVNLGMYESTDEALEAAARRGRIIFVIVPVDTLRDVMLKAHRAGYTDGEYVFFSVHLFNNTWRFGNHSWERGDEYDHEAKLAYEALMTYSLFEPTTDEFREFQMELERRRKRDYNWTSPPGDDHNVFASGFHDAVILFSLAVNETLSENGNLSDGYALTRRMWNRTFDGIVGPVTVNENGDRDADFSLWDMTDTTNGLSTVVANFHGATGELVFVRDVVWPGGALGAPADTPRCGFDNENPACRTEVDRTMMLVTIVVALCLLVVGVGVVAAVYRKFHRDAEIHSRAWQIKWEQLQVQPDRARGGTAMGSSFSMMTVGNRNDDSKCIFTDTAIYQGRTVAFKRFSQNHIDLNKSTLTELKEMRDLEHPNLARFIGMCVNVDSVVVINEYCPKGSLMDILQVNTIKLDWLFKYSLIIDVLKGVQHLHRSLLSVHGRLSSSNCLVDSRFVLKLSDFGLHGLRGDHVSCNTDGNHALLTKLLWVAPERLRYPELAPTKEGDIYSVGIIMREIVTREAPFENESRHEDLHDIIHKIKNPPPSGLLFRQQTEGENSEQCSQIAEMMKACWSEEPKNRPNAGNLSASMTKLCKEKNMNTNILDNLLDRMEQYANNLEELVQDRTAAFLEEKKRAEMLLYELLPRTVADQLKEGKSVNPESYESVTIFFSDIKGFTELSAQSTPMQVVVFLNDLYTCFDGIIGSFDVYKVETIGDAYMVVSGVPVRNGNAHAREVSNMALALLKAVDSFKIRHKNNMKLYLRAGIHTGPCVAGVVGLKMPRYCLFGDTVNTASRMESTGEALKIHISSDTRALLENFGCFQVQMRGDVELKGKGVQTTFWLLGSSDPRCGDNTDFIN